MQIFPIAENAHQVVQMISHIHHVLQLILHAIHHALNARKVVPIIVSNAIKLQVMSLSCCLMLDNRMGLAFRLMILTLCAIIS